MLYLVLFGRTFGRTESCHIFKEKAKIVNILGLFSMTNPSSLFYTTFDIDQWQGRYADWRQAKFKIGQWKFSARAHHLNTAFSLANFELSLASLLCEVALALRWQFEILSQVVRFREWLKIEKTHLLEVRVRRKKKKETHRLKPLGYLWGFVKLKTEKGDSQIKATRVLLRFRDYIKKSPIFFARLRRKKKKETNVRFAH